MTLYFSTMNTEGAGILYFDKPLRCNLTFVRILAYFLPTTKEKIRNFSGLYTTTNDLVGLLVQPKQQLLTFRKANITYQTRNQMEL